MSEDDMSEYFELGILWLNPVPVYALVTEIAPIAIIKIMSKEKTCFLLICIIFLLLMVLLALCVYIIFAFKQIILIYNEIINI